MANHASHAALPYPIKGARFTLLIPYLDADGDPTDPTTPDTEVSKDDGAAADAAEEVASPKNSVGMLTLTGAETDCSCLSLAGKAASGPKTTLGTLYPRVLAVVGTGTLSAGSAGGGTLGTLLAYDVTGCFIKTTGGTGGGGTGGANNQARKMITYNTSTGAFTVAPNWETTPSTDTTYEVLLPDGVTLGMLQAINPATPGRKPVVDAAGLIDANAVKLGPSGSGTAQTARDIGASVLVGDKTGFSLSGPGIQAIWDALTSALTTVGSIGKLLVDKMGSVSGQLASQSEVTSIQNNTRCVRVVPEVIERPDAGTTTYRIELLLYDAVGNMEAPDSAPTLDLVNQAGTDLSSRLDSTTGSLVSTGRYRWIYTASSSHDLEQLIWAFSVVEGGATRVYGNSTLQVDTTAVDFTSSDRTKLEAIHGKLPSKNYLVGTSNSDGDVQIDESTGDFNATQQARFLTAQQTRDAMKLAPTAGAPAAGSVDQHLDDVETAAEAVEAKLPTAPYLAGSENEDGSIAVDVGDIDLDISVHPYSTTAPQRVIGTRITLFEDEAGFWVPMTSHNADRTALNLTGKQLQLIIEDNDENVLATLAEGSGVLEVVSAAAGTWRFKATAEMCPAIAENKEASWWTLSDVTSGVSEVLAWGRLWVQRRAGH